MFLRNGIHLHGREEAADFSETSVSFHQTISKHIAENGKFKDSLPLGLSGLKTRGFVKLRLYDRISLLS